MISFAPSKAVLAYEKEQRLSAINIINIQFSSHSEEVARDARNAPNFHHLKREAEHEPPHKRRCVSNSSDEEPPVVFETDADNDYVTLVDAVLHGHVDKPNAACLQKMQPFAKDDAVIVSIVSLDRDGQALSFRAVGPASKKSDKTTVRLAKFPEMIEMRKHLHWASSLSKRDSPDDIATGECRLHISPETPFNFKLSIKLQWRTGFSATACKVRPIAELFAAYFPPVPTVRSTWDPQDFYESVHEPNDDIKVSPAIQTDDLETKLYPFQRRAVDWMLLREGVCFDDSEQIQDVKRPVAALSYVPITNSVGSGYMVSQLLTQVEHPTRRSEDTLKGGILAEEMGLGKTVEIIALILLNKRLGPSKEVVDSYTDTSVVTSAATLIITPPTILDQWKKELETHAPSLRVMHYEGVKHSKLSDEELKKQLLHHDVVLTTYGVLASEIYYAEATPQRGLRQEKKYAQRRTPLIKILWWRVCLDEAQMVESGVSNAAKVARLIPRENAWAVSGTPLRKDVKDLLGLLIFLRHEFSRTEVWNQLITDHKDIFKTLFGRIALRHTKAEVRDELHIPPQRRIVISMPFSTVEEQNYLHLFQQMCDDCGLDRDGGPLKEDWNPNDPAVIEKMRTWLARLRQTCLHAEIGVRNRKALGKGNGPLRTVEEVLEVLIEQNETSLRGEERGVLQAKVTRAHLLSFGKARQSALDLYLEGLNEATYIVDECRKQLATEQVKQDHSKADSKAKVEAKDSDDSSDLEDENVDIEKSTRLNVYKQRLRAALEMQHIFTFFSATAYYQLKEESVSSVPDHPANAQRAESKTNNESSAQATSIPIGADTKLQQQAIEANISSEKSTEVQELERKESAAYEDAKAIRKELLAESTQKTTDLISKVVLSNKDSPTPISPVEVVDTAGGIESRKIIESIQDLSDLMNVQRKQLHDWRRKYIALLTARLLDQDEDLEMTGEEYELSTKQQDEQYVYHEALRAAHADRHCMITGQINPLINGEMTVAMKKAIQGTSLEPENKGPAPELMISMLSTRALVIQELNKLTKRNNMPPATSLSLRGIIAEMRSLITALQWQEGGRSNRCIAEGQILEQELKRLQQIATEQTKILQGLERELDLFRTTMNQRLDFYRQLQLISDTVAPLQEEETDEVDEERVDMERRKEQDSTEKLATYKTKRRFLTHLRAESSGTEEQRICVICQSTFEIGVLTVCGHQYCKECISLWWNARGTCPTCKRHLKLRDFHQITYKPKELQAQEESSSHISSPGGSSFTSKTNATGPSKTSIYTDISHATLNAIKSIDLRIPASYGTKVDTLARHLLYLRSQDPGCKSIIFSQYRDFLNILASAFSAFKIGHASITDRGTGRNNGIARFRDDPAVECFLLHAKADSSGLNLVHATHVFLCEPLINPAIELQAIARVHRIGQRRETTVWMYLVKDTVEEAIYSISVERRLAHIQGTDKEGQTSKAGRKGKGKHKESPSISNPHATSTQSRAGNPATDHEERTLDAANSLELQAAPISRLLSQGQSGGEVVEKNDLWGCLFGKGRRGGVGGARAGNGTVEELMARDGDGAGATEVGRFLRREAADGRRQGVVVLDE